MQTTTYGKPPPVRCSALTRSVVGVNELDMQMHIKQHVITSVNIFKTTISDYLSSSIQYLNYSNLQLIAFFPPHTIRDFVRAWVTSLSVEVSRSKATMRHLWCCRLERRQNERKKLFFFAVYVREREREGWRKSNQYTGALPFQNNVSHAIWDGEGSIYDDKVDLK